MKKLRFPASCPLDLRRILAALRTESFAVKNVGQEDGGLLVFLEDGESKDPRSVVQWFIHEQERISRNQTINIVTAISRPELLPRIYKSMMESVVGTAANVRWILVVDAPGYVPQEVFRMIRDSSRIKIERVMYPDGPVRFGIAQKNMGIDLIEDGFYHCLDDDNIVHPDFFKGITRAIAANPGKKAFAFNQQRWDKHGDLRASPENMRKFHIDNTMFVVHKDLIGEDRYDLSKAGEEDFYFFRKLYDKDPGTFVFLDETLAYYNYLNCLPTDTYKERLAAAMVTIPRPEDYFRQTVDSLDETGFFRFHRDLPLRLVAGWPDTSHIDRLRTKTTRFFIDPLGDAEAQEFGFAGLDRKQRCAFGHFRAMRSLLSVPDWDIALVFEDDVKFAKGWRAYLDQIVPEIRKAYGDRWMLSLYRIDHAHQKGALAAFESGKRWFEASREVPFWGTQAIVYPRETLERMPWCLLEKCIKHFDAPVDITLGFWAREWGISILVSAPSLVQHIGGTTTGQSSWFHQAECFRESVEDLLR
jgi:hypothetical protein